MMNKKRISVITLGCSKNSVDTQHLLAHLGAEGFDIVDDFNEESETLDYLLLNTCGFIGDAKQESIDTILEAVELKKSGRVRSLVVFGCLSQRYAFELREEIPEVDAYFGARDLNEVAEYLGVRPCASYTARHFSRKAAYAYLKISEGCDRRCSYCAIPFIRGAHRSVPLEEILAEARSLAASGIKELILIAQDTTYYGLDIYGRRTLGDLLRELAKIEGIEWIRIHYSYPAAFPEDVLEVMATCPKICRYLDIPLQHISDSVLKNMHRGVDGAWTRDLISKMRARVPNVVLRTTMIVGFPYESEDDFAELLSFVDEARFERLGAFTYSEEEGTYGADNFPDTISQDVKNQRLDALMERQRELSMEFNRSRIGTHCKVLVDEIIDDGSTLICRSEFESPEVDGEILVKNNLGNIKVGDFLEVKIIEAQDYDLIAEII